MTLAELRRIFSAPFIFLYGNDASAKEAFALWLEDSVRHVGGKVLRQKASFIKTFKPVGEAELFGKPPPPLLVLEGVSDAYLSQLESFGEAYRSEGRVLAILSQDSRKISQAFSRNNHYATCGLFKNAQSRRLLVHFFFELHNTSPPTFPKELFLTHEFEESLANVCRKWLLLSDDSEACRRLQDLAKNPARWDVQALSSMEPVAAIRMLLTRALKNLDSSTEILALRPTSTLRSPRELLEILLEKEILFKRKFPPPKNTLFHDFL